MGEFNVEVCDFSPAVAGWLGEFHFICVSLVYWCGTERASKVDWDSCHCVLVVTIQWLVFVQEWVNEGVFEVLVLLGMFVEWAFAESIFGDNGARCSKQINLDTEFDQQKPFNYPENSASRRQILGREDKVNQEVNFCSVKVPIQTVGPFHQPGPINWIWGVFGWRKANPTRKLPNNALIDCLGASTIIATFSQSRPWQDFAVLAHT